MAATTTALPATPAAAWISPDAVLSVGLFLGSLATLTLCMMQIVGPYDEGIALFGAERVLHGAVPHRDFYVLYGPGQFYVIAFLYKLFGTSVLVERAWTTFVSAASVVLIFLVVNGVAPRRFAIVAAVAALTWFRTQAYGAATVPCMAAMLAGLVLLAPMLGRSAAAPRLLAAGLCAGVVMLFRYDVGVAVFGAECALLAVSTWFERPSVPGRMRATILRLATFGAGFAIVAVPLAVAYAIAGVLPDFWFDVVVFPSRAYVKMRSLPLPRLRTLTTDPDEFVTIYLPLVLCVAAVPAMIAAWASRRSALQWTLLALVLLELVWFGKGFVRASVDQMGMALVLAAPLACVLAQPIQGRGRIGFAIGLGALVLCLRETSGAEYPALAMMADNLRHPPDCRPPPGLERMACFKVLPATVETVQYVQSHTGPDDPVFVGLSRHDKIFVNDVTLDFAMNRPAATKWHEFDPGLQTSAPIQRDIIGELQRVRPKLIVLVSDWTDINEPNGSAVSSGVTLLDDYIRRQYEVVATFGPDTILRPVAS